MPAEEIKRKRRVQSQPKTRAYQKLPVAEEKKTEGKKKPTPVPESAAKGPTVPA